MTFSEVKTALYELVKSYHPGATVVWTKTKGVVPKPPYITLSYSNLKRSEFPIVSEDGETRYYNYDFTFEINLYTVGREIKAESGSYFENTAVEDLEEFIRFLDSEEITGKMAVRGVTIITNPPIMDLSELIGDTKFNYRSMCEFTVSFSGLADGQYGVLGSQAPNPSGGGTEEYASAELPAIDEVEVIEEPYEGGNE